MPRPSNIQFVETRTQVLNLTIRGYHPEQIANELNVSIKTVYNHIRRIEQDATRYLEQKSVEKTGFLFYLSQTIIMKCINELWKLYETENPETKESLLTPTQKISVINSLGLMTTRLNDLALNKYSLLDIKNVKEETNRILQEYEQSSALSLYDNSSRITTTSKLDKQEAATNNENAIVNKQQYFSPDDDSPYHDKYNLMPPINPEVLRYEDFIKSNMIKHNQKINTKSSKEILENNDKLADADNEKSKS